MVKAYTNCHWVVQMLEYMGLTKLACILGEALGGNCTAHTCSCHTRTTPNQVADTTRLPSALRTASDTVVLRQSSVARQVFTAGPTPDQTTCQFGYPSFAVAQPGTKASKPA